MGYVSRVKKFLEGKQEEGKQNLFDVQVTVRRDKFL